MLQTDEAWHWVLATLFRAEDARYRVRERLREYHILSSSERGGRGSSSHNLVFIVRFMLLKSQNPGAKSLQTNTKLHRNALGIGTL